MSTSRQLIIPQKRPLLPSKTVHRTKDKDKSVNVSIHRVLNTNTIPAEARMKQPTDANQDATTEKEQPTRIELSFASYPQPFLDPATWEGMLKRRARGREEAETADQRRLRREREAEYGSMAIRGRASIRRDYR